MLKVIILLTLLHLAQGSHFGLYSGAVNPFDVFKFTEDFFTIYNKLVNNKPSPIPKPKIYPQQPNFPPLFPPIQPDKSAFKTVMLDDMRPGSKKVFKLNNGRGIAFRSKDGNAGGMSFSSGPGNGFAFGGTFDGANNGEFVMSKSGGGPKPKVTYTKKVPNFAKNLFNMFPFLK